MISYALESRKEKAGKEQCMQHCSWNAGRLFLRHTCQIQTIEIFDGNRSQCTVGAHGIEGFVDGGDQGSSIIRLAHRNGNRFAGAFIHHFDLSLRMSDHVIVDGDLGVDGCIHAALKDELERVGKSINTGDRRTVFFCDGSIGGRGGVGCLFALEILKGLDLLIILADNEHFVGIDIRRREAVFFSAGFGITDSVAGKIETAGINTLQNGIPVGLFKTSLDTESFSDRSADFNVLLFP